MPMTSHTISNFVGKAGIHDALYEVNNVVDMFSNTHSFVRSLHAKQRHVFPKLSFIMTTHFTNVTFKLKIRKAKYRL